MRAIRNSVAGSRHTVSPGSHYSYIEREARASARGDTLVELGAGVSNVAARFVSNQVLA